MKSSRYDAQLTGKYVMILIFWRSLLHTNLQNIISQILNIHQHCCENLKPHTALKSSRVIKHDTYDCITYYNLIMMKQWTINNIIMNKLVPTTIHYTTHKVKVLFQDHVSTHDKNRFLLNVIYWTTIKRVLLCGLSKQHTMKTYGVVRVLLQAFLNLALHGGEWLVSCHCFTPT